MKIVVTSMTDPGHASGFLLEDLLNQHPSISREVFSGEVNVHILVKN
jgi:hypothetical protein